MSADEYHDSSRVPVKLAAQEEIEWELAGGLAMHLWFSLIIRIKRWLSFQRRTTTRSEKRLEPFPAMTLETDLDHNV